MATVTVEFNDKDRNGCRSVRIRITCNRTLKRVPTKVVLNPNEYKVYPDGRVKITNNQKYFHVCDLVTDIGRRIDEIERKYPFVSFTAQQLYDKAFSSEAVDVSTLDFFDYAEKWLDSSTSKGKKNYKSFLNSLERYNRSRRLPFCAITVQFLRGYTSYLSGKPRAQTLYLGAFRHIYKQAALEYNSDGQIIFSPYLFEKFKVPKQRYVGQRALELDEVRRFFAYRPAKGGRAELAWDCCLLSFCLMGTNSADLYRLEQFDGEKIVYERAKTKDRRTDRARIEIAVHPIIRPLFEKYKGSGGYVFNFRDRYYSENGFNVAINKGLKQIGEAIGIEGLQFYQLRHSWASIARNELRADAYTVDKALNHQGGDNKLLDIYVKRDYSIINDLNKRVIDFVFGS